MTAARHVIGCSDFSGRLSMPRSVTRTFSIAEAVSSSFKRRAPPSRPMMSSHSMSDSLVGERHMPYSSRSSPTAKRAGSVFSSWAQPDSANRTATTATRCGIWNMVCSLGTLRRKMSLGDAKATVRARTTGPVAACERQDTQSATGCGSVGPARSADLQYGAKTGTDGALLSPDTYCSRREPVPVLSGGS